MKTFCLQTLGCKVNQYESEQVASLLRARGLIETSPDRAELRIINSCSVTVQAASQSRQETRRMTRLRVLSDEPAGTHSARKHPSTERPDQSAASPRVIVMGCWATSDKAAVASLPGVDAVLTHQDNLAVELDRLLTDWGLPRDLGRANPNPPYDCAFDRPPDATKETGWMMEAGSGAGECTSSIETKSVDFVNENPNRWCVPSANDVANFRGTGAPFGSEPQGRRPPVPRTLTTLSPAGANSLPLLGEAQPGRQRAFLKVQDGCDAHCTYCIIPRLRPTLYSKSLDDAVEEARRLVDAGHVEIVLTGIFLGAYGQSTALRRRQAGGSSPLAGLVDALCAKVPGLKRLRLSSLEPGDLSDELLAALSSHEQVVPHLHLPLQSGSDRLLRRMNRQYRRDGFLQMIERVNAAFDRPALTTDVIVGFPGEDDSEFELTVDVVKRANFIHVHAFPYSPRPGTAAARWTSDFVHGPAVNERISLLRQLAEDHSLRFRYQFLGESAQVIVERGEDVLNGGRWLRGRCERYFMIHFEAGHALPGDRVEVRIEQVTPTRTVGAVV